MNDHSQDDLNKFFKNKLSDDKAAENSWNVPPMDLFHEAMTVVNQGKEKKRKRILAWLFLGFLIVAGTSTFWYTKNYINSIENKIEVLEETLASYENEIVKNTVINSKVKQITNNPSIDQNSSKLNEGKSNEIISITAKAISLNTSKKQFKNEISLSENKSGLNSNIPIYSFAKNSENLQDNILIREESNKKNNILKKELAVEVKTIPTRNSILNFEQRKINLKRSEIKTVKRNAKLNSFWSLSIEAVQNLSCMTMDNMTPSQDLSLVNYDHRYRGVGINAKVNYNLNNFWQLNLIGSINRYNNQSSFNHRSSYDVNNEHANQDGSYSYDADILVITPLGDMSTLASFSVASNQYDANDKLINQTEISQKFDVLSAGLGISSQVPVVNKAKLYLGTGLLYNWIINYNNTIDTKMSMNQTEMINLHSTPKEMNYAKTNYMSLYGELVVQYDITPNFGMTVGTQFSKSISSLRLSNNQDDPNTYLHNIGFKIGSRILF